MRLLLGLVALHIVVALGFTWPLAREWDRAVPGLTRSSEQRATPADSVQCLWNVWWFHDALSRARSPMQCDRMAHPQGAELYFNASTLLNGALAYPFVGPLGLVPATNIMVLLNLVLAGLAASGLGWEATRSRAGALIAGLAFGPAPFVFGRWLGHWHLTCTAPLALGAWLLLRLALRPTVPRALALGAGLALAGFAEYTYLLFLVLLAGLMAGAAVLRLGPAGKQPWPFCRGLVLAGAVSACLLSPILLGAWRQVQAGGENVVVRQREAPYSADLLEYLLPNLAHPLWREHPGFLKLAFSVPWAGADARRLWPGAAVLALAAFGLGRARRQAIGGTGWWGLMALVALVLSMGGTVRVLGQDLFPDLYEILDTVPVLGYVRAPGRYSALVQLALAVLAAVGAAEAARRWGRGAVAGAALLLVFEFLPAPIPLYSVQVPEVFRAVQQSPEQGAVFEIGINDLEARLYQTTHQRPTVGCYYSRAWDRDQYPGHTLRRLLKAARDGSPEDEQMLRDLLEAWQVRFLVLPPDAWLLLENDLDSSSWVELQLREAGWSLYRVRPQKVAERAALEGRLLAQLLPRRRGIQHALLLAFHSLHPEGPRPEWDASDQTLGRHRSWWRRQVHQQFSR